MLRSVKSLQGLEIKARDGDIGRVKDFYFDDKEWIVRYFVIETGNWLFERRVLISPASVIKADWAKHAVSVSLTKEQIENSPPIDKDKPVSRQKEVELATYFAWPTYWPVGDVGVPLNEAAIAHTLKAQQNSSSHTDDDHLRSAEEVIKYQIQAMDDQVGHVDDLILEEETWTVRYLVVDTRKLLPGKKVLLPPKWVEVIDWSTETCHVDLPAELIKNGPIYDPTEPVNREIEERLYDYYGRPQYWSQSV